MEDIRLILKELSKGGKTANQKNSNCKTQSTMKFNVSVNSWLEMKYVFYHPVYSESGCDTEMLHW